jgi:hypothetical protein
VIVFPGARGKTAVSETQISPRLASGYIGLIDDRTMDRISCPISEQNTLFYHCPNSVPHLFAVCDHDTRDYLMLRELRTECCRYPRMMPRFCRARALNITTSRDFEQVHIHCNLLQLHRQPTPTRNHYPHLTQANTPYPFFPRRHLSTALPLPNDWQSLIQHIRHRRQRQRPTRRQSAPRMRTIYGTTHSPNGIF